MFAYVEKDGMNKMEKKENTILVSVVVPIYNVENYLERCLKSIINQSYKNIEIILVDDGSSDNSGKICDNYALSDKRVIVIHQSNIGAAGARNAGIEISNGEFICFIDSDDYISEKYIQILLETIVNEKSDIVICNYITGKNDAYSFHNKTSISKKQTYTSGEALNNWHGKYKDQETSPCNKIYRTSLFKEGLLRYPLGLFCEDVLILHKIFEKAKYVTFIDATLYYYFERKKSVSRSLNDEKIVFEINAQKERMNWFKDKGYTNAYERLLSKVLKYYLLRFCQTDSGELCKSLLEGYDELLESYVGGEKMFFLFCGKNAYFIRKLYRIVEHTR